MKIKIPQEQVIKIPSIEENVDDLPAPKKKTRVAAYCRVSSEKDEQIHSLDTQTAYYREKIGKNPDWIFVGIYADKGISGTSMKHRENFQRMIADCNKGKIDLILVKSVARFGRNIVDVIATVRHVKSLGIGIIFEEQSIDTRTMNSEMMLAFHSAFSQSESEVMRENIIWGNQKKHELGEASFAPDRVYGYKSDENGEVAIDEKQATVIRYIAACFLDGASCSAIAKELTRRSIPTPRGKSEWRTGTISTILTNINYRGDIVYGKTYKESVFSKQKKNEGQHPIFIMKESIPPIFTREEFSSIQKEIARRKIVSDGLSTNLQKSGYRGKFALTERMTCGLCENNYRRISHTARGKTIVYWSCSAHFEKASNCPHSRYIRETELHRALMIATLENYLQKKLPKTITIQSSHGGMSSVSSQQLYQLADLSNREYELSTSNDAATEWKTHQLNMIRSLSEELRSQIIGEMSDRDGHWLIEYDDYYIRKTIQQIKAFPKYLEVTFMNGKKKGLKI